MWNSSGALRSERMKLAAGDPPAPVTRIRFTFLRLDRYVSRLTLSDPSCFPWGSRGPVTPLLYMSLSRTTHTLPGLVVPVDELLSNSARVAEARESKHMRAICVRHGHRARPGTTPRAAG